MSQILDSFSKRRLNSSRCIMNEVKGRVELSESRGRFSSSAPLCTNGKLFFSALFAALLAAWRAFMCQSLRVINSRASNARKKDGRRHNIIMPYAYSRLSSRKFMTGTLFTCLRLRRASFCTGVAQIFILRCSAMHKNPRLSPTNSKPTAARPGLPVSFHYLFSIHCSLIRRERRASDRSSLQPVSGERKKLD
jgi:hypothetical protein